MASTFVSVYLNYNFIHFIYWLLTFCRTTASIYWLLLLTHASAIATRLCLLPPPGWLREHPTLLREWWGLFVGFRERPLAAKIQPITGATWPCQSERGRNINITYIGHLVCMIRPPHHPAPLARSVLLCSIVYYPHDGFCVLSVECGFHSVQIKCCSIYGGQGGGNVQVCVCLL